jgi:hypothetical protein
VERIRYLTWGLVHHLCWGTSPAPLFTNVVEGEFYEVHIPDPVCSEPKSSAHPENLSYIAPASRHLTAAVDRYALSWMLCSIYFRYYTRARLSRRLDDSSRIHCRRIMCVPGGATRRNPFPQGCYFLPVSEPHPSDPLLWDTFLGGYTPPSFSALAKPSCVSR